tara:strand:- start:235 stop:690 length:456 start_codon:yes stop_codon:yes gene_type:complete
MQLELKQIIAEEVTKLVLENVEDCADLRLKDLELIDDLFDKICDAFDELTKAIDDDIDKNEEPDMQPDGMDGIGGGRPMPPDAPSSQTHTVVAGDTFWEIARRYLGNPLRWKEVMNANTDLLKNRKKMKFRLTNELIPPIRPGDKLQIPPR